MENKEERIQLRKQQNEQDTGPDPKFRFIVALGTRREDKVKTGDGDETRGIECKVLP